MEGLVSVFIFLIFLSVIFNRKPKQVQKETPRKPLIPMLKKDPWAPDTFVTDPTDVKSMLPEQSFLEPVQGEDTDRIVAEDNFWSANEIDSYFNDNAFQSLEGKNISDHSVDAKFSEKKEQTIPKQRPQPSVSILPELAPESLVQAFVMQEVLNRPRYLQHYKKHR
ncbi:MAG: hypothetical protein GX781_05330 [Clostridiales bacterium]|nr:hypothetical protein [Clostridiales bacterium]